MKTIRITIALATLVASVGFANPLENGEKISMSLESVPISRVLTMLATQNKLNLVSSGQIDGDISIRLDNVDLRTALDAILTANGYTYVVRDNVVVVTTADASNGSDLESRILTLSYIDPVTAKMALESRRSEKGQVIILDKVNTESIIQTGKYKPNRIMITDYPSLVDELVSLVAQLDVPERIVFIEARIIETKRDATSQLGFLWPSQVSTKIAGAEDGTSSPGTTTTSNRATGSLDIESGRWTWGTLSVDQLSAVLDLLEQSGNAKLISDPKIATAENHEAEIKVATVIPIQTINRFTEAAATQDIVTFQDFEVGISLRVIPRINGDGNITLDVEPVVEDIIGYSGPPGNQKPITAERSIRTRITVKDGETAALGGLLKEDDITRTQRVPILGHIPLLGKALFSNTRKEKSTSDLLILITPHVVGN
jgi:type IV pilus secretin PilQ/predicted competence protein